jgi:hypothetical protein
MIVVSSCNSCSRPASGEIAVANSVLVDSVLVDSAFVEKAINLDKEAMFLKNANYRWFETGVVLKDWLDEENDGSIEMVVNVFQVVEVIDSTSFDTYVVKFQHVGEDVIEDSVHGFWVEDYPLNEEVIKVSFKEAFEKVQEVNLPKPHTRQVVLRKQVGPVDANPQWIFGNLREQIYVDAVTGAVSKDNPAFGGLNLGTPLGEWP